MNNSQMEEFEISCDKMAEHQCRSEQQCSAGSALKENPQVQFLIIHIHFSVQNQLAIWVFLKNPKNNQNYQPSL